MGFTNFKYEVGSRFGDWILIENKHGIKSIFLCTRCGNQYEKQTGNIFGGRSKCCINCRKMSPEHKTFTLVKQTAKRRKIDFNISESDWLQIAIKDCHYCGSPPSNCISSYGSFKYNGLDRIDPSKAYNIDNVVPSCRICNRAKSDIPYDDFIEWLERILNRVKKRLI